MKLEDFELLCVLLNFCVLLVLVEMQTEEEKKRRSELGSKTKRKPGIGSSICLIKNLICRNIPYPFLVG